MVTRYNIGFAALIFGLLYWPLEALIHTYLFDSTSFFNAFFHPESNEIWMRLLISFAFITFGIYVNRTLHQQNELIQKLHHQHTRSRRIIESAYDAYISIDAENHITEWNTKAESIFGWSRSQVIGKALTNIIIPERFRQAHEQGMSRYLKTASGPWLYKKVTTQAIIKSGAEITIEMAITPLFDGVNQEFYTFIRQVS